MSNKNFLCSSSDLQTTKIDSVNLKEKQRIQKLMSFLPFTTILTFSKYLQEKQKILERQKTLEIQKTKLIDLKNRRVLECITFLSIREGLDYKNKIQFIKTLEEEFESYIEIGDLRGAESILSTLYHNHERWQPYCPIKREEGGGHYYQTSFKN